MTTEKSKLLFLVLILFGISLLVGCGAQPTSRPTAVQLSPTAASPSTITPTETPAETASVEPSPTAPPYTRCQEIIDAQMPKDFLTEGSIIFIGECYGKRGLYRLSAATHKIEPFLDKELKDGHFTDFHISKNHQWMAIGNPSYDSNNEYISTRLIIVGENEANTIQYPMDRNWTGVDQWLNGGIISMRTEEFWSKILLNPFTGAVTRFSFYPDDVDGWNPHIAFDPYLAYAVYLNEWQPSKPQLQQHYILREIKTGRILWESKPETDEKHFAAEPLWAPNGAYFVIGMRMEDSQEANLIVVSRDGQREIISETFTAVESFFGNVEVQWSPNGKYLSYWEKMDRGDDRLVLWEPGTNRITYPDVPIKFDAGHFLFPIFFQGDQKFMLRGNLENGVETNYLVDLKSGQTAQFDILSMLTWIKTEHPLPKRIDEPFPLPPKDGAAVKQTCLKPQKTDGESSWGGALVFFNDRQLYTLLPDGKTTILANTQLAFVSPNRKWLLYVSQDDDYNPHFWLGSLDTEAKEIAIPNTHSWTKYDAVYGWFSNDELWISSDNPLFNPFTNISRKPPEFEESSRAMAGCIDSNCPGEASLDYYYIYDQALERYIFLSGGFPRGGIFLLNRSGDTLWSHSGLFVGWNMPKWQPGDERLGFPTTKEKSDELGEHYEIVTINRNGFEDQLTNYTTAYPTMTIDKFSWSPDGRYIAFWGDTHSQENIARQHPYRLFVLDTVSRQTIDYCVAGNYLSHDAQDHAPVWSPDGRQIAVNGILDGKRQILLVDFASGTVSPVAEGELIGWMAEP